MRGVSAGAACLSTRRAARRAGQAVERLRGAVHLVGGRLLPVDPAYRYRRRRRFLAACPDCGSGSLCRSRPAGRAAGTGAPLLWLRLSLEQAGAIRCRCLFLPALSARFDPVSMACPFALRALVCRCGGLASCRCRFVARLSIRSAARFAGCWRLVRAVPAPRGGMASVGLLVTLCGGGWPLDPLARSLPVLAVGAGGAICAVSAIKHIAVRHKQS